MKIENIQTISLDRSSILRANESWIHAELQKKCTRIVPIHDALVLCDNSDSSQAVFLTRKDFIDYQNEIKKPIFLGVEEGVSFFAINILLEETALKLSDQVNGSFQELRSVMPLLGSIESELLALARFMVFWHTKNQYCGKCGRETKILEAGHLRTCKNDQCNERYYPNMDPAIIVLVTHGEKCLLGRQKEWREGVYSTLAGFVEPGETIEDAVIREIQEEAGIVVEDVEYVSSQPWLFPNALMLGFKAKAKTENIVINEDELDDIQWFTREEIKENPEILPYKLSIAHELIMEWL